MEVNLFPNALTFVWTVLNLLVLLLLLLIPAALIFGVVTLVRLSRRVRQLEDRLNQMGK